MMAAQLIASHSAAIECYRRAMIGEQSFEGRRENLNQANKLSRSFATLLDALNRHRGKGQQKVTVEHVHVHSGGQAIVGAVAPGGGIAPKDEEPPHAKQLAYAPEPPMRSADAARQPVSVASDDERPLSDARGAVTRRTEGYALANGTVVEQPVFRIKSLKVGDRTLENVVGSAATADGSLLLGQSFLGRFKSWSIDNTKHALVLE
jgi:hypothetical protein